jgi:hypothetical protein
VKNRMSTDHARHVVSSKLIRDIDGSIVWHYSMCSCGWEGACEEVRKHILHVESLSL